MRRPKHHDNPLALGNGAIIAAQTMDLDVHALSRALLQAHWRDDADHADAATIAAKEAAGVSGFKQEAG